MKKNDGYLQFEDIAALTMKARVVVLSGCRTGIGKPSPGEGLAGLTQAFFIAGNTGVIASLWQIDDECSAWVTEPLFKALAAGKDPDAALKEALLEARKRIEKAYSKDVPALWAAFTYTGA